MKTASNGVKRGRWATGTDADATRTAEETHVCPEMVLSGRQASGRSRTGHIRRTADQMRMW